MAIASLKGIVNHENSNKQTQRIIFLEMKIFCVSETITESDKATL